MKIDFPVPSQIPHLRQLWQEAFGDDDQFLDWFFSVGFSRERCRVLTVGSKVAAALYWFPCQCRGTPMAYLYAVATGSAYRRQGLCRRLMEDTHRHLQETGYGGCILVPAEPSLFSMYESMGYRPFSGKDTRRINAGKAGIPVRAVSWEEYAALRLSYLPQGGVVQEGLPFLAGFAQFYAGEDFIFTATEADGKLFVPELLGNTAIMEGIPAALDKTEGWFSLPGSTPFAMYLPLSTATAPTYFAFSFQ